jgi:ABC-type branched-subunit amino acid transport system substrate-binding protein
MAVSRKWRGALTLTVAAAIALVSAACGSSGSSGAAKPSSTTRAPSSNTALLGTPQKATGTPVKIGQITTGGNCSGCTSNYEEPAASAAASWLNDYQNGVAGHPITLDVCVDNNDPGKATDCANQMIRDGVAAVVLGSSGVIETEWKILNDAGVPVIEHASTQPSLMQDTKSTFVLADPNAQTLNLPIAVAKQAHAKKVSLIVVDVPTATDLYKQQSTKDAFKKAGIEWKMIAVPLGQADLTPQAQQVITDNPDGVVAIIGSDVTCIPALNGLHSLGFKGTVTTISYCITDAMRKAVPGEVVKGMRFGAEAPFGDTSDRSMQQYAAILDKYVKGQVPFEDQPAVTVFQAVGALGMGTKGLTGNVTPASITAALKGMDNVVLPASGGRVFRCNGKASSGNAAVCSVSLVTATLDAKGNPTKYTVVNNNPISG